MILTALFAIVAAQAPGPTRARANLMSYVSDADYPPDARRNREEGTVGFVLHVSAEGRVTRCDVMQSSGSRALDLRTCQIMIVRARFTPARNAAGEPEADSVSGRVHWILPDSGSSGR